MNAVLSNNRPTDFVKKHWYVFAFFAYASLLIFIFSEASPMYYINNSYDSSAYFPVGIGILQGKVPYRDMFEHKGPYMFFIQALGALIGGKTYFGIMLFEISFLTISLYYVYKIASLYLNQYAALAVTLFFPVLFLGSNFEYGNLCEEYVTPFILQLIYTICKTKYEPDRFLDLSKTQNFVNGLIVGFIFFIKFTMTAPWVGFYLCFMIYKIYKKDFRQIGQAIVFCGLGFFLALIPGIVYFMANNSLFDLYEVYFYINIGGYSHLGLFEKLFVSAQALFNHFFETIEFRLTFGVMLLALLSPTTNKFVPFQKKIVLGTMFIMTGILLFFGVDIEYYILSLTPFALFGLIIIVGVIFGAVDQLSKSYRVFLMSAMAIISFGFLFATNVNFEDAKPYLLREPYQLEFANIIQQSEDKSVFTYNYLDLGLSVALGQPPSVKYYYVPNLRSMKYSILMRQEEYIVNQTTKYIVMEVPEIYTMEETLVYKDTKLLDNYEIIAERTARKRRANITVYLLERKEDISEHV